MRRSSHNTVRYIKWRRDAALAHPRRDRPPFPVNRRSENRFSGHRLMFSSTPNPCFPKPGNSRNDRCRDHGTLAARRLSAVRPSRRLRGRRAAFRRPLVEKSGPFAPKKRGRMASAGIEAGGGGGPARPSFRVRKPMAANARTRAPVNAAIERSSSTDQFPVNPATQIEWTTR